MSAFRHPRRPLVAALFLALSVALAPGQGPSAAESPEVEAAWQKLSAEPATPKVPSEWQQKEPNQEAVQQWLRPEGERLRKLAAQARNFARQYPESGYAGPAMKLATQALFTAMRLGAPGASELLAALDEERLQDPKLPPQERFPIRVRQLQMQAAARVDPAKKALEAAGPAGPEAEQAARLRLDAAEAEANQEYLAAARALIRDFPDQPQAYGLLLEGAGEGETAASRAILEEVANEAKAPHGVRERAKGIMRRADAIGKKLELRFIALDGREVDLERLQGKVVLVDFWATWSGPGVAALAGGSKRTYEDLQKADFEIIGVSFDKEKDKLEQYLKDKGITWPQYFDGKYFDNDIGRRFGIDSLPTMWLVDRKGILRDVHAHVNLAEKVAKLLAEEGRL